MAPNLRTAGKTALGKGVCGCDSVKELEVRLYKTTWIYYELRGLYGREERVCNRKMFSYQLGGQKERA